MELCIRCRERWFEMKLEDGICHNCRSRDTEKKLRKFDSVHLISWENCIVLGDVPPCLRDLTTIEESIIARAHCYMTVTRVRGQC
jgi:hypothetical protein